MRIVAPASHGVEIYGSDFKLPCICVHLLSHVRLFATLWTVAQQAPLYLGFHRQEYWSAFPFPPPGDLPNTGIELMSPVSPACFTTEPLVKLIKLPKIVKGEVSERW